MNTRMWQHPATQANVATLRERGVDLVGPSAGELAEGEEGIGRMAEPEEIHARIEALLARRRRVRSRASAYSSRREGRASRSTRCATSATARRGAWGSRSRRRRGRRGADVTLLAANLAVPAPAGVTLVETPTAADLEREALERADADVIVMAAAVADYRPAAPARGEAAEGRRRVEGRTRADDGRPRRHRRRASERPGAGRLRRGRRRPRSRASP